MPKHLPPLSPGSDGARQQAFHRLAGWTWALCGLASTIAWLALPIDFAETAAIVLVVTALAATILHLVRLARRARTDPPTA
jgi:Flp pilus assembly protein TadB